MIAPDSPRPLGCPIGALACLQPVGLATAQILAYYAVNAGEVRLAEALPALGVAAVAAVLLWLLLLRPMGGARPAALVASLVAFAFWAYARSVDSVLGVLGDAAEESQAAVALILLVAGCAALVCAGGWIRRTPRDLSIAYRVLDVVSLVGVAVPLFSLVASASVGDGAGEDGSADRGPAGAITQPVASTREARPNIYLIVLDAYGRDDELAHFFGIEEGLGALLEKRGFYVAKKSRANYTATLQALPSLLNYDYLPRHIDERLRGAHQFIRLVNRSRFVEKIRRAGYRFVSYETGIKLSEIRGADEYIVAPSAVEIAGFSLRPGYFERGLLSLTPAGPFLRGSDSNSQYAAHRTRVLHALQDLPRHASSPMPRFVFAHILSPHEPFVFGRHGEDVSPRQIPYALNRIFEDPDHPEEPGQVGPEYARRYAAQAEHLAELVLASVDEILARSSTPPIIIVQGDHGPYGFSPDVRRTRLPILNAYWLPGNGKARLYPSISPVNSLRLVLDEYFGADLPLLRDRSFYSNWTTPTEFVEVD